MLTKEKICILSYTTHHHPGAGLTVFAATNQPCPKSCHRLRSADPVGLQVGFSFLFQGRQTGGAQIAYFSVELSRFLSYLS